MNMEDAERELRSMVTSRTREIEYWKANWKKKRMKPSEYAMTVASLEREKAALDVALTWAMQIAEKS